MDSDEDDPEGDDELCIECLDDHTASQLNTVKRTLLPSLDEALSNKKKVPPQPHISEWGPTVATRRNAKNHGAQNIVEKAEKYQMKRNSEIPPSSKVTLLPYLIIVSLEIC